MTPDLPLGVLKIADASPSGHPAPRRGRPRRIMLGEPGDWTASDLGESARERAES